MKLFKDYDMYISKDKWRKIFLAVSIMTITLYIIAMIFSLCGSDYFILNYQNTNMDKIQMFLQDHKLYSLVSCLFLTLEFSIITSFVSKHIVKIYYPIAYYAFLILIAFLFPNINSIFYTSTIILTLLIPLIENLITTKKFDYRYIIRFLIAVGIVLILQAMILVIKAGYFDGQNHIMNLSAHFIYAIEYDIALSVILYTVLLYIDKEKGDSGLWATYHSHSSSSQTLKTSSQRLSWKNLSKKQKNKLIWFFTKLYFIQIFGFLVVMVLPFLVGKVFEFLVMYLSFAIARYILGFKYSLHFQNESLCLTVGAVVFGILTLAVPFFYVALIIAILLGIGLAVLLHLSYKYKGFWLFAKMAKPDKFATLYVIFNGNLSEQYILRTCKYHGIDKEDSYLIYDYMQGDKLFYLSKKYNYSIKTLDRKLNDAIDLLNI